MRKLFALLHFVLMMTFLYAQEGITITGTVKDETGITMPGVTVYIKESTMGTITNIDGKFNIEVPSASSILGFSFVGYETQEKEVGDHTFFEITLFPSITALEEVVAIGYGTQKKESLISSISQVKGSDLRRMGVPNVSGALSGTTPGVSVISQSGQPGEENADIYIRGRSSLNESRALILVDGVEITGDFSNIDPNEIEAISILKDASATAVYGVKGANGVIIITTKRGKVSTPLMSFMVESTFKQPTRFPERLGAYETMQLANVAYKNDQRWGDIHREEEMLNFKNNVNPSLYPDVQWYDEIVKDVALSQRANFTVQGGTDFVKYFGALGFLNEGDIFQTEKQGDNDPRFNYKRYSFRTNLDFNLTDLTTLAVNLSGRLEDKNRPNMSEEALKRTIYELAYTLPPHYFPVRYPADIFDQFPDPNNPDADEERLGDINLVEIYNPLERMNKMGFISETSSMITSDFELNQNLEFITEGLSFIGRFSYSSDYAYSRDYDYSVPTWHLHEDGRWEIIGDPDEQEDVLRVWDNENLRYFNKSHYYRFQLMYENIFDKHEISAMGLFSRRNYKWGNRAAINFPRYREDWVGRITYNYDNTWFIEGNGAYNGSERFAPGMRFGFFPSGAVGWNISNMDIFKSNISWVSLFKIRYSLGQVGSEAGADRWMYQGEFSADSKYYEFGVNYDDQGGTLVESKLSNPNATWETATKENLGFEIYLFNNAFTSTIDLYREKRDGIFITPRNVPAYFGSSADIPRANLASTKSHGMEIDIGYNNTIGENLRYNLRAGYSFNDTRVIFQDDPPLLDEHLQDAGKPIGVNQVYLTNGFYQNIDEVVNAPANIFPDAMAGDLKYLDYNADGVVDQKDRMHYGFSSVPKKEMTFQMGANYKGLILRMLFAGSWDVTATSRQGGTLYIYPFFKGYESARPEHFDYWSPENPEAQFPSLHINLNHVNQQSSTYTLQDLRYFRWKSFDLSYAFTTDGLNNMGLRSLRVYLSGNNLLLWAPLKFGDPEGGNTGASHASYPMMRRINIGLEVTF
jgi:TonB-linked SusC/RagA family outer membrane protein